MVVPGLDRILFTRGLLHLHFDGLKHCLLDIGFAHYNQLMAVLYGAASLDHLYYNFDFNQLGSCAPSICHPHSSCLNSEEPQ